MVLAQAAAQVRTIHHSVILFLTDFFLLQRAIVILRHRLAFDVTKTLASAVAPMAQWVYSAMPVAKGISTFLPVAKVTKIPIF